MSSLNEVQSWVASLDATLLPCLPARELQAADRSTHPSHHVDVERHAREFMEAAKQLQVFFIRVQHEHQPPKEELLKKEIAGLESELRAKDELIKRQKRLLQGWSDILKAQKLKHIHELERV
ncbi:hypothetical protein SELMODRAFT_74394 [Selaginella moellendorffii]|uniref:Mediator of RNA polymerase II transcription subunit 28 n=1 Tax=Selaginella moellendorffii TaxID=88036 RepID=D8QQD7_SELML|nr:mediator of RNA polymerase II transcription subunit 28 [Selaginella moellendorffii]XP_024533160.1 mediator of RNA polymerase II transcription subunit 28 [Selaginella moellendorffii]EFJ38441.1 hypothetical protein SELMODRAFT_74394 [Selaginella moellendorffii]|eukprot:XP_002960902.1 mediator of RNA polymerase II transcription subunit 28 [Selaginella moellendorffii]